MKKARRFLPFSQFENNRPEALWTYLSRYERETGGDAIAIPHNGNLTRGHMFLTVDSVGMPLNKHYAVT
mgnify:CR=1 FL=1